MYYAPGPPDTQGARGVSRLVKGLVTVSHELSGVT